MFLDASLLNAQHYKVCIKGKVGQSRRMDQRPSLHLGIVVIEKGGFGSPSSKVANFTYFIIILEKQRKKKNQQAMEYIHSLNKNDKVKLIDDNKNFVHICVRFNEVLTRRLHTVSYNALDYPKEKNLTQNIR